MHVARARTPNPPDMIRKMLLPRERLGAVETLVGVVASVDVHVVVEVLLARERLRAESALERSLPGVLAARHVHVY